MLRREPAVLGVTRQPWRPATCIAAAVTTCLPAVLELLWIVQQGSGALPDGDDAPYRASVLLLMFGMPAAFVLALAYFAVGTLALRAAGVLRLQFVLLASLIPSIAIASTFARQGFLAFGVRDALISFLTFGSCTLLSLVLGSLSWWLVWRRSGASPRV